jgi:hypothetical protein
MKQLGAFLIAVFGICIAIGVSLCVMINGWGLQPKNLWWVIGGSLFGQVCAQIVVEVAKQVGKDD